MSDKDGGPAFPAHDYVVGDIQKDGFQKLGESRGMTLRDYFAAKVLQGIIAESGAASYGREHTLAKWAYAQADAMLKERQK